jgi:hypothetical protein
MGVAVVLVAVQLLVVLAELRLLGKVTLVVLVLAEAHPVVVWVVVVAVLGLLGLTQLLGKAVTVVQV